MRDWIGVAAAVVLTFTPLWRSIGTHLVTVVHEGGHALVSGLSSGRVRSIRIDRDGTGRTWASPGLRNGGAMRMAGYLTPPALGLGVLALAHADRGGATLLVLLVGLVLVLLSTRNLFGLVTVLLLGAGLYLAAHHADGPTQDAVLVVLGWTLLLGSLRDTVPGFVGGLGDSQRLSEETGFPALVWTFLFVLGACAAVSCAFWLTLTRW